MISNPVTGAGYFFRGLSLINKPGVRRFVIVPLLINILIGAANRANIIVGLVAIGLVLIVQGIGNSGRIRLATLLTSSPGCCPMPWLAFTRQPLCCAAVNTCFTACSRHWWAYSLMDCHWLFGGWR